MALDDKEVEQFEKTCKQQLFDRIRNISSNEFVVISNIQKDIKYMGLNIDLSNIGIALNNKFVELQHKFEDAGISMYIKRFENYGLSKLDFMTTSFIGESIKNDLGEYAEKGLKSIADYTEVTSSMAKKKLAQAQKLTKARGSSLKGFWNKVRSLFVSTEQKKVLSIQQKDVEYTQEEKDAISSYLYVYKNMYDQIWNYNLEDNLVASIVKQIKERKEYPAYTVPELLEEIVNPDLQKLGLEDLIPKIQSTLIEEYKKDLPDVKVYQIRKEDLDLYIPNFSKPSESNELHAQAKIIVDGVSQAGKVRSGVTLEDFSAIDQTVSAFERQTATAVMAQELDKDKKSDSIVKEEAHEGNNDDILL